MGPKQHSPESVDAALTLWRAATRWRQSVKAALAPLRLTLPQYLVLRSLVQLSATPIAAPSQRELGDDAQLDKMTVSKATRALEERGWVDRDVGFAPGQPGRVIPTNSGIALLKQATPTVAAACKSFLAPLGRSPTQLAKQLERLQG